MHPSPLLSDLFSRVIPANHALISLYAALLVFQLLPPPL